MAGDIDLKGLIESAQRAQAEAGRVREELGGRTVDGETGGGLVRVVANGRGEILSVTIDPAIVRAEDHKMIEDLVVGAVNLALARAQELMRSEMAKAIGLPPGMLGS